MIGLGSDNYLIVIGIKGPLAPSKLGALTEVYLNMILSGKNDDDIYGNMSI